MNCQRNVNSILLTPLPQKFFSPIRTKLRLIIIKDELNSGIGKIPTIAVGAKNMFFFFFAIFSKMLPYLFTIILNTQYLCQTFRYLSEFKLTEGVFVGADIRKLMKVDVFEFKMKKGLEIL
jgi:hypothetical protein